ncbi:PaaI family thioesterase [Halorarius halobius]|uniref:PaaI family thioesterase n=1 Tax=Halorarius halobius TaxID=2962671 RepID=UPI0020CFB50F|nr:PaaI family thioesterase [Halorarius halobius]
MTDANERFLADHDHLRDLGIAITDQREGYVRLRLPHDDALTNPGSDAMQGGVVSTLIDHGGGAALRTTLDEPLETPHASTELNVSFVQPATDDLVAEAEVVRSGYSRGVVTVEVRREGDGETVATGRVSLYIGRE